MTLKIDLPGELDQEQVAATLEVIAAELRNDPSLDDREQMDGSIFIATEYGPCFITPEDDEK